MPPVQCQDIPPIGLLLPDDNNAVGKTASMKAVRTVPAWEHCTFMPSPEKLSDEISQQVLRRINESPACQVFFAIYPDKPVRFTGVAKMRLCQCGVTCREVDDSLVLSSSQGDIATGVFSEGRYNFVANLKINRLLATLTKPETANGGYCVDWTLEPNDLFEYFTEQQMWRPVKSSSGTIPEVMLDPRYISFAVPPPEGCPYPRLYPRLDRYKGDAAARCLAEAISVFCYALNTDRADAGKVADMKMLLSPNMFHPSSSDDVVEDPCAAALSAEEFLERIQSAPGGFDYLSLLEDKPVYKADSLDVNQVAEACKIDIKDLSAASKGFRELPKAGSFKTDAGQKRCFSSTHSAGSDGERPLKRLRRGQDSLTSTPRAEAGSIAAQSERMARK